MKRIEPRKALENVIGRMVRQFEQSTGRLPDGNEQRAMEEKARRAAQRAERRKG